MLFRKDGHNVGSKMRLESCTVLPCLLINTAEIVGIDMRFGCASVCACVCTVGRIGGLKKSLVC